MKKETVKWNFVCEELNQYLHVWNTEINKFRRHIVEHWVLNVNTGQYTACWKQERNTKMVAKPISRDFGLEFNIKRLWPGIQNKWLRHKLVKLGKFCLRYYELLYIFWSHSFTYAVFTQDTFTWGTLTFLLYCVTFSVVKWHLLHVNVSRVNTALLTPVS